MSPAFLLLAATLYYLGGGAALVGFLTACLAHELGHLIAILLTGAVVQKLRLAFTGPVIEYGGALSRRQELCIAAAGPLAGLLLAAGCSLAGTRYFAYVGMIAALTSFFNLLPIMPLDGGRMCRMLLSAELTEEKTEVVQRIIGSLCAVGVTATGLCLHIPTAIAAGIWLLVLANRPELR